MARASLGGTNGGGSGGSSPGGLSGAQIAKLAIAVVLLLVAGGLLAFYSGVFDSSAPLHTEEELRQIEETVAEQDKVIEEIKRADTIQGDS